MGNEEGRQQNFDCCATAENLSQAATAKVDVGSLLFVKLSSLCFGFVNFVGYEVLI